MAVVSGKLLPLVPFWQDGDKFWRMPECYIRGSTIKYLRIPDEIIDMVKEEVVSKGRGRGGSQQNKMQGKGRGGGGRGERKKIPCLNLLVQHICLIIHLLVLFKKEKL